MKQLITKSDGTPTKSKVHALQFLEKNGIPKEALIAENGQFYYEAEGGTVEVAETVKPAAKVVIKAEKTAEKTFKPVTWETEVFDKNNERTKLVIPGADVEAFIIGKHPAGQSKVKNSFEICANGENFIMSLDLLSKIFVVKE